MRTAKSSNPPWNVNGYSAWRKRKEEDRGTQEQRKLEVRRVLKKLQEQKTQAIIRKMFSE